MKFLSHEGYPVLHHQTVGLIPVLATPFHSNGALDLASLRRLVEFQVESGADGVAVFGMASEGFALSGEDREAILAALRQTAPSLPIVAGVSLPAARPALEELQRLADAGVAAAMVMPPAMVKPSSAQIYDFFAELGAAGIQLGVDIMVQDAPGATGVTIPVGDLEAICGLPGIASVKIEAPPTIAKFEAITPAAARTETLLLGGQNAQFVLDEYERGASGTMPASEFTDLLSLTLAAYSRGEKDLARALFSALLPLIVWGLQPGLAWAIHKIVLRHRGIIDDVTVRAPARSVSDRMAQDAIDIYERCAAQVRAMSAARI